MPLPSVPLEKLGFLTIGIVILMVGLGALSGISVFNIVGPRLIDRGQYLRETADFSVSMH